MKKKNGLSDNLTAIELLNSAVGLVKAIEYNDSGKILVALGKVKKNTNKFAKIFYENERRGVYDDVNDVEILAGRLFISKKPQKGARCAKCGSWAVSQTTDNEAICCACGAEYDYGQMGLILR